MEKDNILKMKRLMEYSLKTNNTSYPSFDDYKKKFIEEEEKEPLEPISTPAEDGMNTIPEPPEENNSETPIPTDVPPQQEIPQHQPQMNNQSVQEPQVNNQGVEPEVPQQEVPQQEPQLQPEDDYVNNETDEMFKSLEDKLNKQDSDIKSILKLLSPEPEQTPEEILISKIDKLSKEVNDLKNTDNIKKDKIKNISPFNISLSKMWNDTEDEAEKEFKITDSDIENYDPTYIRKSLGL